MSEILLKIVYWSACKVPVINGEVNSVRKHNYNCMLDDGIY